ncbi:MAG: ComEC/Rec2 family competence protein [Lachnospiraceae bacterium]|nr:ComEC/Rec2 family competence protein [Lachnospiraceae bacterium]
MRTHISNTYSAATRTNRELRFFPFSTGRPLFAVLAIAAAAIGMTILLFPPRPADYEPHREEIIQLTGTVCSLEPRLQEDTVVWRMILSDVRVESPMAAPDTERTDNDTAQVQPSFKLNKKDKVLCILDHEPEAEMSSRVRVSGKLFPFRAAMNEGEFDLRMYYHILRIEFSLRDVDLLAASAPADRLAALLFHFKNHLSSIIDRLFSKENSPVLKAMLLGEKGMLEEETKELYQGAGIIHILSISGLHLSLLGMGLFSLTGKCGLIPIPVRAALSIITVFLYGKMIGMGTSVFRALIMLTLYIISKVIGRTYDLLTAASIAAFLLLPDQPLYLLHTGFQFSFGAVLAIGFLLPALPGRILKAAAIPLATLPVYLWAYGTFPITSLLLNLIVIPLMTVVMISAGGSVLFEAFAGILPVSRLIGLPSELILDFYRFLAETSSRIPGHEIVPGRPAAVQVLLFYTMLCLLSAISVRLQMPHMRRRIEAASVSRSAVSQGAVSGAANEERDAGYHSCLRGKESVPNKMDRILLAGSERTCLLFRLYDNRERKIFACIFSALWLIAALFVLTFRRPPAFEMDVLYVGQGDGIFISCEGRNFLIDGGSSTKEELAKYTLIPFLHCKGVSHLDGIIISHEDSDHCSGLLEFLEAALEEKSVISISAVYLPDIAEETKGENYLMIEELSEQAGIPVRYISCGQRIRAGNLFLDCLHPARGASYTDANEYSATMLLRYPAPSSNNAGTDDAFSAMLTGDIEEEGEKDLCAHLQDMNITVLKVAHHGSRNATSDDFLKLVHPQAAVISAGVDNLYGHPHKETIQRIESCNPCPDIYRTDLAGEISFRLKKKGDNYQVKTFLGEATETSK